jgi:hypothetical protein
MSLRPILFRLALAAACFSPFVADMAQADTVADKPRLVVAVSGQATFVDALKTKLEGMRRFELLNRPNAKSALQQKKIALDGKLSVEKSKQALAIAGTDLMLDGKVENAAGGLRITSRLYDFRTGEITRDLSLIGDSGDVETLAGQLASFVRHNMPLKCEIKAINEDQIVLDLGSMDGVVQDSLFKVFRHRHNLKPREIGLVRVVKADPFAAAAEAESTAQGVVLEPGDILIEQTSAYVLSQ